MKLKASDLFKGACAAAFAAMIAGGLALPVVALTGSPIDDARLFSTWAVVFSVAFILIIICMLLPNPEN